MRTNVHMYDGGVGNVMQGFRARAAHLRLTVKSPTLAYSRGIPQIAFAHMDSVRSYEQLLGQVSANSFAAGMSSEQFSTINFLWGTASEEIPKGPPARNFL